MARTKAAPKPKPLYPEPGDLLTHTYGSCSPYSFTPTQVTEWERFVASVEHKGLRYFVTEDAAGRIALRLDSSFTAVTKCGC